MNTFTERDPAERSAFNRLFYRNRRPTWLGHWVSQFFCWWARVGLPPQSWFALEVRDRKSGRMRADAVVVPSVAGERYVVSMFGTISDWVHNIEAARGDAVTCHGSSLHVPLVLVPPEERAPILQEYVRVASSGRKHFPLLVGAPLADFAVIAPQYPVYRVEVPNLNAFDPRLQTHGNTDLRETFVSCSTHDPGGGNGLLAVENRRRSPVDNEIGKSTGLHRRVTHSRSRTSAL
jgi:hypothetical protein